MTMLSTGGQARVVPWGALGPWLALLATCIFFATQSDRFLTGENLSLVLQQVMVVGVLAIGQTLIILTAGIVVRYGDVLSRDCDDQVCCRLRV
jgi:fructose transport system permease protein